MKLILTSAGLKIPAVAESILAKLPQKPSKLSIAHIITASNVAPDTDYVRRDKDAMNELGFSVTDITLEGRDKDELYSLLKDYDIIYVQGGNGFYLLRHIRDSGFELVVKKLLEEGRWYVGVSAGTYVCCPTIEMHCWKRNRDNRYGLTDLEAMNLVDFLVTVHYNRKKYQEKLAKHIPTASAPVRILTDEQALYVEDDKVELIGEGKEIGVKEVLQIK